MKQVSEEVKSGGLTGQGFINLLGRPHLTKLALILREAVQNSWDARLRESSAGLRFRVGLRNLDRQEEKAFRKIFDQSDSLEPNRSNTLAKRLEASGPIRVLEISDFGAVGLGGLIRPDLPTGGVDSRFVNFFFDVGRTHEASGDGGTYGFGRSSLYMAGRASVILVDSLVQNDDGSNERRMMACRIGESFEVASGRHKGRFSGRHFWGRPKNGIARPLLGSMAKDASVRLGMPGRRGSADTGTTVMIPWPVLDFDDGHEIISTLVHHLWPKMVPTAQGVAIQFSVEVDGKSYPVPDPAGMPEYRLLVQALKAARSKSAKAGARQIATLRPQYTTGSLGVATGVLPASIATNSGEEDSEDERKDLSPLNKVALMRPSELVVRYMSVDGADQADKSWAGVFICSNEAFVQTAFARSEPPAHDDWSADRLEDRHQRYVVKKTVHSLIPNAVREALGIDRASLGDVVPGELSLGGASARFASMFLSGDGQGPSMSDEGGDGGDLRRNGGGGGAGTKRPRVKTIEPVGLELQDGTRIARYRLVLQGEKGTNVQLHVVPVIHSDGTVDSLPEDLVEPIVQKWSGGKGKGTVCEVRLDIVPKIVEVDVAIRGDYGVAIECSIAEGNR